MQIANGITSGKIQLPELDLDTDEDYEAVWALVDSGSSVHVVDAEKFFPGAKIVPPKPGSTGFKTANSGTVPDLGSLDIPFVTGEGQHKVAHWINAKVAMPILSSNMLAANNGEVRCRQEGGEVTNLKTGDQTAFISRAGVYF